MVQGVVSCCPPTHHTDVHEGIRKHVKKSYEAQHTQFVCLNQNTLFKKWEPSMYLQNYQGCQKRVSVWIDVPKCTNKKASPSLTWKIISLNSSTWNIKSECNLCTFSSWFWRHSYNGWIHHYQSTLNNAFRLCSTISPVIMLKGLRMTVMIFMFSLGIYGFDIWI